MGISDNANTFGEYMEACNTPWDPESDPSKMFSLMVNSIFSSAKSAGMYKAPKVVSGKRESQPWFSGECRDLRYQKSSAFRKLKRQGFNSPAWLEYEAISKNYKKKRREAKKAYYDQVNDNMSQTRNAGDFWSAVRKYRGRSRAHPQLDMAEVEKFFDGLYPSGRDLDSALYRGTFDPTLDSEISYEELTKVLSSLPNNKSSGKDKIPYEFYGNLPEAWKHFMHRLFNKVLELGRVPEEWTDIKTVLLFKKGDIKNVANYRGISLICTVLKIFHQILLNRLLVHAEQNQLIPEIQSGFRRGRGCMDNIFTLASIIAINTRLSGRKVFACFIDFRRAFDTLSHRIMWQKLSQTGISAQFINIVSSVYRDASFSVAVGAEQSKHYSVNQGILQGDVLSPTLFSLFVADLEEFLRSRGVVGVPISSSCDVACLFYADDLILLNDSYVGMQRMLGLLHDYCTINELQVNCEKSKAMVFRRGGPIKRYLFHCGPDRIDVVNQYTYLGITFFSSGCFREQTSNALKKGLAASCNIISIIKKSRNNNVEVWKRLFSAMSLSTCLYGAEIWALPYMDTLERVNSRFFKSLLNLPWSTPDIFVRKDLGLSRLKIVILKKALGWWASLLSMEGSRLPRRCFDVLQSLDRRASGKLNWISQIRRAVGASDAIFSEVEGKKFRSLIPKVIERIRSEEHSILDANIGDSRYNEYFKTVCTMPYPDSLYMDSGALSLYGKQLLAQLRMAGTKRSPMYLAGVKLDFDGSISCKICNSDERDTLEHLIRSCKILKAERSRYFGAATMDGDQFLRVLKNEWDFRRTNAFMQTAARLRKFIVTEGREP